MIEVLATFTDTELKYGVVVAESHKTDFKNSRTPVSVCFPQSFCNYRTQTRPYAAGVNKNESSFNLFFSAPVDS